MPATLRIHLFGGFKLAVNDRSSPIIATAKARSLFAYLALHAGIVQRRDLLAGVFWPELPGVVSRRRLSQALWRIHHAFEDIPYPLRVSADSVLFRADADLWLDVRAFEASVARGEEQGAIDLYRGEFMAGFYDDWITPYRERFRDQYLDALEKLLDRCKIAGKPEEALRHARRLALAEPLRESAHCEIMKLCHLLGRHQEAIRQFEILRRVLAEELGLSPSPAAMAVYRQLQEKIQETPAFPAPRRAPGTSLLEGLATIPMVGRETERNRLLAMLEDAIEGRGRLVLVEGEPGVGKTRLLEEIADDARWRGLSMIWSWGEDTEDRGAYAILNQALTEGITPLRAMQLQSLVDVRWLSALATLLPSLQNFWPDLPPPPTLSAEAERRRVHEALSRTLLALGIIHPHLIILEDMHWADLPSLEALAHLAPHIPSSHLLIILSFRGSETRQRGELWRLLQGLRASGADLLLLQPLNREETTDLVQLGLNLQQAAPRFARRIYKETRGNPFFVLETLRALHEEGALYQNANGFWSTRWDDSTLDYRELPLPSGVQQVIARRLEKLPSASWTLLKAVAVLGDRFDFDLISRLSSGDQIETLKTIQDLISRRFLEEDRDAYRFTHNLVRRVALGELDAREKEQWHRAALDALIALHPEAVEALAYHAIAGKRWREAVRFNQQAGDRARAMYAGDKAIIFYTRALEAQRSLRAEPGEIDFELLRRRGEAFQETGRFTEAEDDFSAIIRLASQTGDMAAQAAASNDLSYLHFQRGSYEQALQLSIETYEIARQLNSEALIAHAFLNSANALRNLGRNNESILHYQQAAMLFESLGDDIRLADCLTRMGYAHLFNGHLAHAEETMVRGMTMRRRLDERVGLAYSLINLTGLYLFKGALASASQTAAEAYEIALATGDPYGQDAALAVLGNVSSEQGAFDQALDYLERALIIGRKIGDRPLIAEVLAEEGRIHSYLGNAETAHKLLMEALRCQKDGGEIWHYGAIQSYLAEWELSFGEAERAWDHARTALNVVQQLRAPYHLAEAHRIAGMTLAEISDESISETPATHFEASLQWLEGRGFRPSLAHTLAAYGRYLLQRADEKNYDSFGSQGVLLSKPPRGGRKSSDSDKNPLVHLPEVAEPHEIQWSQNHARGTAMLNDARAFYRELGMDWRLDLLNEEARHAYKQIIVRLPRAEVPAGRPLKEDEWVAVRWRISARDDDDFRNKGERRRHRLLRLLSEADAQNAAPRVHDLARALGVSPKTIKRDLAALRSQGAVVHTRGSRG